MQATEVRSAASLSNCIRVYYDGYLRSLREEHRLFSLVDHQVSIAGYIVLVIRGPNELECSRDLRNLC